MNILFVCSGNVGRSQIAEVIFNSLAQERNVATSAGTTVKENEGQKLRDMEAASNVLTVLKEIGVDATENTRNQLTPELIEDADVVVSMAEVETLPEYLANSPGIIYWKVADPFNQSLEFTQDTRDEIGNLVKELLKTL